MVMSIYESRVAEHSGAVYNGVSIVFFRPYVFDQAVFAEQIYVLIDSIFTVSRYYRSNVVY